MSSLTSFNYEHVGDTYEEILAHYKKHGCAYARRKLEEFEKDAKQMEKLNKGSIPLEKYGVIELHIQVIKDFLASKGSSCAVMGGRSRRAKKSKRSRRVKKSKRSKRTRRNH